MLTRVYERFLRNMLVPESTADTHENPLSLNSFVSFVVRNPGQCLYRTNQSILHRWFCRRMAAVIDNYQRRIRPGLMQGHGTFQWTNQVTSTVHNNSRHLAQAIYIG